VGEGAKRVTGWLIGFPFAGLGGSP
jgi:hypothetical protein